MAVAVIGAADVFTYEAVLRTKLVAPVMELTVAFGGKYVATMGFVAAFVAFALIVNAVAESIVRMRVLFGRPVPWRNMPALRFVVSVPVMLALVEPFVVPVT